MKQNFVSEAIISKPLVYCFEALLISFKVVTRKFHFIQKVIMGSYVEGEAPETDSEEEQYMFNLSYMKVDFI